MTNDEVVREDMKNAVRNVLRKYDIKNYNITISGDIVIPKISIAEEYILEQCKKTSLSDEDKFMCQISKLKEEK